MIKRKGLAVSGLVVLIILLDQLLKIWVKTTFTLGEDIAVASWFHLHFTENNGMAFGLELVNKNILTVFRLAATAAIGYMIHVMLKRNYVFGFVVCVALIFAGALGNSIDCLFYGVAFGESTPFSTAAFLPDGGGYASLLNGRVVDMLYFPLFHWTNPDWMPLWGGKECEFFSPIFNLADSAICVGVASILLFHQKTLKTL